MGDQCDHERQIKGDGPTQIMCVENVLEKEIKEQSKLETERNREKETERQRDRPKQRGGGGGGRGEGETERVYK